MVEGAAVVEVEEEEEEVVLLFSSSVALNTTSYMYEGSCNGDAGAGAGADSLCSSIVVVVVSCCFTSTGGLRGDTGFEVGGGMQGVSGSSEVFTVMGERPGEAAAALLFAPTTLATVEGDEGSDEVVGWVETFGEPFSEPFGEPFEEPFGELFGEGFGDGLSFNSSIISSRIFSNSLSSGFCGVVPDNEFNEKSSVSR